MSKPQRQKRKPPRPKSNLLPIASAILAITLSAGVVVPSIAAGDPPVAPPTAPSGGTTPSGDATPVTANPTAIDNQVQKVEAEAASCADTSNPDGLAAAQLNATNDRKTMLTSWVDIDKMFSAANAGGCFNALSDFPNLSVTIPSLSSITNGLQQALVSYATRKVCSAVNDAISDVISPINEAFEKISENGQLDLTGRVNKEISKKLYETDPELGRLAEPATSIYSWNIQADAPASTDPAGLQPKYTPSENAPPPTKQDLENSIPANAPVQAYTPEPTDKLTGREQSTYYRLLRKMGLI